VLVSRTVLLSQGTKGVPTILRRKVESISENRESFRTWWTVMSTPNGFEDKSSGKSQAEDDHN
jgi:hypothetical protein